MRQFVVRTLSAVLFLLVLCSQSSLLAQNPDTKKPRRSSGKTAKEITLKAEPSGEGSLKSVTAPIAKGRKTRSAGQEQDQSNTPPPQVPAFRVLTHPREDRLTRGRAFHGDLRTLPQIPPEKLERPEFEEPAPHPILHPGTATGSAPSTTPETANAPAPAPAVPAPTPSASFDGLDFLNWGAGHPPDTNGDVGPIYYIQTINTSIGIFRKSDHVRVAAFTFNAFFSGHFGNLCDTNNFGDPVVLYDTFEDRWIITDFAFQLVGGNVAAPTYQCFAVSQSGDPVSGGWNFYSIQTAATAADAFGDYPKFGVWPDGLYMSANMFNITGGAFRNPRVWAFNKAQMYAGLPTVQILSFDAPANDFTILPSNARLQAGTPPPGTPNYFVSTELFLNALGVYKFHVDWNKISLSTFSGPDTPLASTSWPNANVANATSPGNALDVLQIRAMVQNQYTNLGGQESLWTTHTVRRANTTGFAASRWYQTDVTGGTVNPNLPQAATFDPDGANVFHRFIPSLAVDHAGNLALGYSKSNSTTNPSINYAGRLAGDPVNTFSQTEQLLIQGTGTQTGSCGGTCTRWGDYSAMTLDPDGCTFWYTNMYYATSGLNFLTRIGTFSYPSCTPVATGTVSGQVTASGSGNPIQGATVALGSRTTTTDINGNYSFAGLPSGTYPSITASSPGFNSSTTSSVVVTDGNTTIVNFALTAAAPSGCFVDTLQADFQAGLATNCDLTGSPDNVILLNASNIDQQNLTLGTSGVGITTTTWGGQTFTPSVTGQLTRADINLFCSGCTGTTPNLTLSVRGTSGGLPTGADLASTTITGFSSGAAVFYTGTFGSPATLTAGTQYALVIRPTVNPSPGTYALTRSGTATAGADVYPGGTRVAGATSGTVWSIPLTGGVSTDAGFKIFINTGFAPSGTFVSSLKDSNPAPGNTSNWGTLSWVATTPANTNVQFQAAASNSASGPFSFVGPDGTAGTFFTNGGSLAQFNNSRYLKYRATLTSTDSTVTPSLDSVSICFTDVSKTDTTTTVTSSQNPSVFGQSVTFTATVSPVSGPGTPTGTVTFLDGGSPIGSGTLSGGVATFTTSALTVGNHTITTNYGGDASFNGSTGSLTGNPQVVNKADTATTVTSSANPSVFGQSVTFTATVSAVAPGAGTPTGTVTFLDGGSPIGTGTLSGGIASFTTSALAVGNHTITTNYGGDGNFNGSTGSLTGNPQVVNKANTATTVTSSLNPSVFGQSVTFTATVSAVAPGSGTPSGTVTFLDGGSPIGSGTLSGGVATFTTSALAVGNHTITTNYGGDGNFNGSTGSLTGNPQVVNKADTATTVTSSANPSVFGQSVTFTATVSAVAPGAGTPTGTVTFLDGGSPIGTGTLSGGIATFTTSALAVGNHTITTNYGGDGNFNGSTGSLTGNPQVVNKADTSTTVTSSVNPSVFGQSVTFTATVSAVAPSSGTPTGTVTFLDGGSPIGTGTLSGGIATFTTSALAVGNHTITTSYGGDANFNGSTGSLTGNPQVVNKADTATTVISSQNPSVFGQAVTFTATVSAVAPGSGTPTGTVTFLDGGSPIGTGTLSGGIATFTTSALAVGNHTITTSYGGDGNFNGSTGSLTGNPQVVNKADTATTVTSSQNPSAFGQSVTFTATVSAVVPGTGTPTGTVTFLDGGSPIGIGTLSGGIATFTTSALTGGNHTITTSYGGDGNFNGSTGSLTGNPQVVNKANTATTVTSSLNPSVFGQSVTFTATVSVVAPGSGTPTGTVTFLDGGSPIGTGTLSGGIATFTTSALAVGNRTITTSNGGDGNFNGSTGSLTGNPQVVNKADTTTTVTSSQNPSVFGQSVTFTATLSAVAPGSGTPTGTVTFLDGGSPIGTGTLSGGVATFTTSALAIGNHTITTSYGGDGNFNGSTGSLTGNPQVVNKANTTTTVISSANPSVFGQSVTFTATVSAVAPGSGTPTGTVTFLDGGSPVGTGTLSGGIATFTTSALAIGNHAITTSYGGDGNFNGSTGSLTGNPQVVNKAGTATTVSSSVNPSAFGQSVIFTATVSAVAPGAGTPAGTVTFLDGGSPIGTGTLSGGVATFTTSALASGGHTITTSYGGDGNFNGSTGSLTGNPQVVEGPPSIAKAFNPTVIAVNGVSTLSLTITNPATNPLDLTGVAVTDNLPAGLVVATPAVLTTTCGGTATAGTASLSLTGGSVAVNSSCKLTVNVTASATGNYVNTTGAVSSTNGGTGNTASASLSVQPADLTITKTHTDPFSRGQTGATYTITVKNSGTGPTLGTVTVVDTLPNVNNTLVATAMSGTGWSCTLGTLTCTRSDALAPGATYPAITLTVNVPSNIQANVTNTAKVSGGGESNTGNDTATDPTHIGPPIQLTFVNSTGSVSAGQSVNFGFTLDSSPGMGAVNFSCSGLPTGAACTFNPPSSSLLTDSVNMNISTTPRSTSSVPMLPGGPTYALLFSTLGLAGIVITGKKGNKMRMRVVMVVSGMALLLALAGCGGRPHFTGGTPAGSYTITVTGTSGATSGSNTVTLNVQ